MVPELAARLAGAARQAARGADARRAAGALAAAAAAAAPPAAARALAAAARAAPELFGRSLPARVTLVEVGPRDGLQNEAAAVPADAKVALIEALAAAGLPAVEATAFVSPKWVPQLADAAEVLARVRRRDGVRYPVLVPNLRGLERALAAGAREVAVFAAATEGFSRRNLNCSVAESLERFRPVMAAAAAEGVAVRGYVSCVAGCPVEGAVAPGAAARVAAQLLDLGCFEVSLGDTIGTGTPRDIAALVEACGAAGALPARLAIHAHDTYGQALANVLAALQAGVATVDTSVAGLGGCPYAPGAAGNVATEDVVYMLNGLGVETGVDLDAVAAAGEAICAALGRPGSSRAAAALAGRRRREAAAAA
jgi:hydroxymethylglutaryl-CoA lyase